MGKLNCWEIKKCGREVGGVKTRELGVCPAAMDSSSNGANSGKNGGRICWAIAGTFCGGKVQGDFAQKQVSCMACEVFKQIKQEEGAENFKLMKSGQSYQAVSR
ncbi:MAG: two-CW domain-containing protein [Nitrospirota bacterium]